MPNFCIPPNDTPWVNNTGRMNKVQVFLHGITPLQSSSHQNMLVWFKCLIIYKIGESRQVGDFSFFHDNLLNFRNLQKSGSCENFRSRFNKSANNAPSQLIPEPIETRIIEAVYILSLERHAIIYGWPVQGYSMSVLERGHDKECFSICPKQISM